MALSEKHTEKIEMNSLSNLGQRPLCEIMQYYRGHTEVHHLIYSGVRISLRSRVIAVAHPQPFERAVSVAVSGIRQTIVEQVYVSVNIQHGY